MSTFDRTDARILLALCAVPRATGVQLATLLNLARNTIQSRLSRWEAERLLLPVDRCVAPGDLGYPLQAIIAVVVDQHKLDDVTAAVCGISEVVEALSVSGDSDLLVRAVASNSAQLYSVAGTLLAIDGVKRTTMSVVMCEAIPYRMKPLIERLRDS